MRVGFDSAGLGTYLTRSLAWSTEDEYVLTRQLRLLEPIFGKETPKTLPPIYPGFAPSDLTGFQLTKEKKYVLMHLGSGDFRSWPLASWMDLGRAVQQRGRNIVLTGAPGAEARIANEVAGELGVLSVAGKLSWNEFVTSISKAAMVISVDTVTGHLAACFKIPSIIIFPGRDGRMLFRPNNPNSLTLTHPVGCAPCYRPSGCEAMACVRKTSVQDVLSAFDKIANERSK